MDKNYLITLGLVLHYLKDNKILDYRIEDNRIEILSDNYDILKQIQKDFTKLNITNYELIPYLKLKHNTVYQDILFTNENPNEDIYIRLSDLEEFINMKDFLIETNYTKQLHIEVVDNIMFEIKNKDLGKRLDLFWGIDFDELEKELNE